MVDAVGSEDDLLYLDWVLRNRQRVEERSGGRLGYLHIPDMGPAGLSEWIKWFYGQIRKEGMVVDVRSNGGGNISPMVIERLRREVLMVDFERHREIPDTSPGVVFHGHLVCLIDEDTASDGDQFAYVFRAAGLGPIIGKRSWGGVVGIYGRGPLIDGGSVSVPEAGSADAQGNWVIEGHGVDPDIVVENNPRDLLRGSDAQLERAIDELLASLEREPKLLPARPADPVKTPGGAR
jgi:tricorn protease